MTATLSFTLPEEQEDFDIASNARSYRSVLEEFDRYLRNMAKYGEEANHNIVGIRTRFHDILEENDVDLY